jgi:formylmethanofuran dehydrogenase subunit C
VTPTLTLRAPPPVRVRATGLTPERLRGLHDSAIAGLTVRCGTETVAVGDLFEVSGTGVEEDEVVLSGDLRRFDGIGAGMSGGRLVVDGPCGDDLGARMSGGEIVVSGDAGEEVGAGMRRGLVVVGGRTAAGAGLRMLAGTVIALRGIGPEAGLGNKRGSLVSASAVEMLPTYAFATRFRPPALGLQLLRARALGLRFDDALLRGAWARWSGDRTELGRGEILIFDDEEVGQ